jgi:LysM repeat protein
MGRKLKPRFTAMITYAVTPLMAILFVFGQASSQASEDTYSISLVQTAEVEKGKNKEVREVDNRKVLAENYTVKKGDHLWQLFRERNMLQKRDLPELIAVLKRLNPSLANLDLIYPGQSVVIPLTFTPVKGLPVLAQAAPETTLPLAALKDLNLENYTVKRGDALIKVVRERFHVSEQDISGQYLEMLKKVNPSIEDLNRIFPGQVVKLPVFSSRMVRAPIEHEKEAPAEPAEKKPGVQVAKLNQQLSEIFSLMGEEWVTTGEHYIPLKSGGQINLKADSFPVLNLSNGNRVIVDLYHELPERMAQAITSSWDNYRIVHLNKEDDLKKVLDKILPICGYYRVYKQGEPLEIVGDIQIRMTGDWIIQPLPPPDKGLGHMILITLAGTKTARMSPEIRSFLEGIDFKVIEYPPSEQPKPASSANAETLNAGHDIPELIGKVLSLRGQAFSRKVEVPVYQTRKSQLNMLVNADFFLYVGGKEAIIDCSGLGEDTLALLRDQGIPVLSLHDEKDPSLAVSRVLEFIGVQFDSKPHPFMAAGKGETMNIKMTIPGIVFQDDRGQNIFASHLRLPDEIVDFLSKMGYKVLNLALS